MTHDDSRWQRKEQSETSILQQYNDITDLFMPIKDKILCVGSGNHDFRLTRWGDCVQDVFCKRLEVPYGTTAFKLIVNDDKKGNLQYKTFAYHPFTGGINSNHADPIMREAVQVAQVKRKLAAQKMGDCVLNVVAHFHKAFIARPFQDLYLVDDGKNVKQRYHKEADPKAQFIPEDLRWYASIPGYQKKHIMGNSGYTERAGYPPVELGSIRAFVVAGKITHMDKVLV